VAVAFAHDRHVIGFDISERRVRELVEGIDVTNEIRSADLERADIEFTTDASRLSLCDFVIVAVPTPVDGANRPDLRILEAACRTVGSNLREGAIIVFESTVFPGTTEEVCVPILEETSGRKCGRDFFVGYSPERINPGDHEHTFTRIRKVVAGQTPEVTKRVAEVYGSVVQAGTYSASSIKVAEAAKVIENTQRDLNIALMNELSLIFGRMGIDTQDVLAAAGTKWNFLKFSPGLVGGHCIGVDPYYLTHKAEQLGYHPQVILAGRRINAGMGEYVADQVVMRLIRNGHSVRGTVITVLGATFKEDVPDLRNSGVMKIVEKLRAFHADVQVHDPLADSHECEHEYGVSLTSFDELRPAAAVVLAVAHRSFREQGWDLPRRLLEGGKGIVADVRSILPREQQPEGVELWRL
jgi:UDP-N-acetyl-D-galactosamine dehydrogenase